MDRVRRAVDYILFDTAIGVTMVTLAAIVMIAVFFAHGLRTMGMRGDANKPEVASSRGPNDLEEILVAPAARSGDAPKADPADEEEDGEPLFAVPRQRYGSNVRPLLPIVDPGYVALLTRTCECQSGEKGQELVEGKQFKIGETLNVAKGLVEIVFACGAKAVLQGPAILQLDSGKSSMLHIGRMVADVPDDVEGFTVRTSIVQVVSLPSVKMYLNGVAKVTRTVDCRWAKDSAASGAGASLLPGQSLKLAAGLAEVTFGSGAKVLLQGPAEFEVESSKTATLHSGRLTADVPDDLEGFRIRTPVAEITALPDPASPQAADGTTRILKAGESTRIERTDKVSSPIMVTPAKAVD